MRPTRPFALRKKVSHLRFAAERASAWPAGGQVPPQLGSETTTVPSCTRGSAHALPSENCPVTANRNTSYVPTVLYWCGPNTNVLLGGRGSGREVTVASPQSSVAVSSVASKDSS